MAGRVLAFLKGNTVLVVSAVAALVSMLFVPPSAAYADYMDWHTLLCLFSMLAVLCAFRSVGVFRYLAFRLVSRFKSTRSVQVALIAVTFVGSMFLTNDMALLTFLPLAALVLSAAGQQKRIAYTFVMQALAANLGGMILPFGNPQNLFLFSYYDLALSEFVWTLMPPFLLSLVLILVCVVVPRSQAIEAPTRLPQSPDVRRTVLFVALFALTIAMVFNAVPNLLGALIVLVVLFIVRREALARVDYPLLLTFVCFFIFSGNLAAIPAVQHVLGSALENGAFVISALTSQVISNVPSAILLAPFTTDWQGLLLGVDIGGAGTPVASLASLIAFAEYQRCMPGNTGRFLGLFSAFNFAFLIILGVMTLIIYA